MTAKEFLQTLFEEREKAIKKLIETHNILDAEIKKSYMKNEILKNETIKRRLENVNTK